MKKYRIPLFLVLFSVLAVGIALFGTGAATAKKSGGITYKLKAKNAFLIRDVTGPVTDDVDGVPAAPVDSFLWDGQGITPIKGSVKLEIDPVSNTGEIKAKWEDENGKWEYKQTVFASPSHPTGLVVGPGAGDTELIPSDPVTTNVYLHGDTTAGGPVLPTVFNLLATWGPAEVTLNGKPFENPYDGPTPLWAGHSMITVGVRNENGEVLTTGGDIFSMAQAGDGVTYDDQLVFHLVFHDAPGPDMTDNVPPPLSFFYHVTFQDVKLDIQGDK